MKKWIDLNKIEKYFFFILIFGFFFKYNFILTRIFYVPSITGIILLNLTLLIIFIYFLPYLITSKKGRLLVFIGYIFFNIFFIANYLYNAHYGNFLSITDIILGESTGRFSLLEVWLRQMRNTNGFLFLMDIGIIFILLIKLNFTGNKKNYIQKNYISNFKKHSQLIPLIIIIILLSTQIYFTNLTLGNHTPGELYQEGVSEFVNVYGILPLYLTEIYYHFSPVKVTSRAKKPVLKEKPAGKYKIDSKPNIIVIQWESLDEKLINYEFNNQELTPFMNKLKEKSLYFNNFYAQHINGSYNADFSFLTSLYPINRNYTYFENDLSKFDSLVRVLNKKGYETKAFHNNDGDFFNRNQAFTELGFDEFYTGNDYSFEDSVMEVEKNLLGINDYDFFKQSLDFLENAEKPFFGFFITVTSHDPFDYYPPAEKVKAFKDIDDRLVQDFFHSITFVDKSIEMFFNKLEKRNLKEDTLFVIYSDHESAIKEDIYTSFRNFNLNRNVKKPHHIPLIIKHPELDIEVIETKGTTTDLAPTILDLLGDKEIPEEFFGQSLLNTEQERPVLFLHDIPQVFYQDQLFVLEQENLEQIGYREETEKKEINISAKEKNNLLDTIRYHRNNIFTRNRE